MTAVVSEVWPQEAIDALSDGVTQAIRKIEIYHSDGETLWQPNGNETLSPRLVGGNITLDYNRSERRMLDLELDNFDGVLSPADSEGFWYNKIIKPYRGVRVTQAPQPPYYLGYQDYYTQLGEYMIDKIDDSSSSSTVKVTGRDYTKKCLTSKLEMSVTFAAGTYLYELIKGLAGGAGIRKLKIPFSTEVLTADIDIERGTERWTIMVDAANSHNYDLFFDNQGYLTMEKYSDPSTSPVTASFKGGSGGNLVTYDKSTNDSRLYNHIVVFGDREAIEGGEILMPYFGEAKNEDPTSPTSIDEIGDRYYSYASSFFTSDAQCEQLALSWLRIHSLESYEISFSSLLYPWLDVGKIVEVVDPKKDDEEVPMKFLLDTLSIPLGLDLMGGTGKRVVAIG